MSKVKVLKIHLFKDSRDSFIAVLDVENIPHSKVEHFTNRPQASAFIECISALSEAMPWNSIAKVIVKWIEAKQNREIMIQTEDNKIIHAKGYSISEIESILPSSVNITVIQTEKETKI